MKRSWIIRLLVIIAIIIITGSLVAWLVKDRQKSSTVQPAVTSVVTLPSLTLVSTSVPTPMPSIVPPIDQFDIRITKKFFGSYVTPSNSPVQPERFTGYHTGVDIEYGEITADVPVRAITEGQVVVSETADGYGGVIVIRHNLQGKSVTALYGHLRPSSMKKVGVTVATNDQIAVLGTAYSSETDGERRHLHFSLRQDTSTTIRGYVQKQSELSGWQDPRAFFRSLSDP